MSEPEHAPDVASQLHAPPPHNRCLQSLESKEVLHDGELVYVGNAQHFIAIMKQSSQQEINSVRRCSVVLQGEEIKP